MRITILTLFPEFFISPLQSSILKRAQAKSAVTFNVVNIRDYAPGPYHQTDDRPFGGGPGMVMMVEPIDKALSAVKATFSSTARLKIVLTSAKGTLFSQQKAQEYVQLDELVIICGHYEGVDERVAQYLVDEEVRIGDYVLTGGEPAAVVMADAVTRLLPDVLGNEQSNRNESHSQPGVAGFPAYTRPEEYNGWPVPGVLLTGHHQKITQWRETQKQPLTASGSEPQ